MTTYGLIVVGTILGLWSFIAGALVHRSHVKELNARQLREYLESDDRPCSSLEEQLYNDSVYYHNQLANLLMNMTPALAVIDKLRDAGSAARGGREWTQDYDLLLERLTWVQMFVKLYDEAEERKTDG